MGVFWSGWIIAFFLFSLGDFWGVVIFELGRRLFATVLLLFDLQMASFLMITKYLQCSDSRTFGQRSEVNKKSGNFGNPDS